MSIRVLEHDGIFPDLLLLMLSVIKVKNYHLTSIPLESKIDTLFNSKAFTIHQRIRLTQD